MTTELHCYICTRASNKMLKALLLSIKPRATTPHKSPFCKNKLLAQENCLGTCPRISSPFFTTTPKTIRSVTTLPTPA